MSTIAYQCGYRAGLHDKTVGDCPYEGHCDASLALQLQWMDGRFDAMTGFKRPITRRKSIRVRWPKSLYARRRLEKLFHMTIGEARA